MDLMRISITVLPVGPRGPNVLEGGGSLWFAVQATAGYEPKLGVTSPLEDLWPWKFLIPDNSGSVALSAWRVKRDGANPPIIHWVPIGSVVPSMSQQPFAVGLQQKFWENHDPQPPDLGLELHFPEELARYDPQDDPRHKSLDELLQRKFPSRVNYLSSLPGEISRRLLATIYLKIDRDELYEKDQNDKWQVKDGSEDLWIAPTSIHRDPSDHVFEGTPEMSVFQDLWTLGYAGDQVRAYGPGYRLERFPYPPEYHLFDLTTHWIDVAPGDARLADLGGFLVKVLDPLSEASRVPAEPIRGKITTGGRALAEEELQAIRQLWRIQALASILTFGALDEGIVPSALEGLADHLVRDSAAALLRAVPDEWKQELGVSLLDQMRTISGRLGLSVSIDRQAVRIASESAGIDTVCRWVEACFEAALRTADLVVDSNQEDQVFLRQLEEAWKLDGPADVRAERRRVLAHLAVEEAFEAHWLAKLGEKLTDADHSGDAVTLLQIAIKEDLAKRWEKRIESPIADALKCLEFPVQVGALALDLTIREALANEHLATVWPSKEERKTENAARPIILTFGPEKYRVVHENNHKLPGGKLPGETPDNPGGVFSEVTGHALLVRRHEECDKLKDEDWRLVSGGIAVIGRPDGLFVPEDVKDDWLHELLPIAEENVFIDGLLRSDRGYDGQLRHVQSPLDVAYKFAGAEGSDDTDEQEYLIPYTYQGLGLYTGTNADILKIAAIAKAPPRRYGDWYQFSAPLIDAGSGLPVEIARHDAPWRIDPDALHAGANIPACKAVQDTRTEPVGEINILPYHPDDPKEITWPVTPKHVVLRAREWQRAQRTSADVENDTDVNVPEILLWQGSAFKSSNPSAVCYLAPPAVNEFTLRRWVTPPKSMKPVKKDAIQKKLVAALVNLYVQRPEEEFKPGSVVHDPAVAAIGLRVQVFDVTGTRVVDEFIVKTPGDDILPYRRKLIAVRLSVDDAATMHTIKQAFLKAGEEEECPLSLPSGWFACLDSWPLVHRRDFPTQGQEDGRFADLKTFAGLLEENDYSEFSSYVAFKPTRLLVEAASASLPDSAQLHRRLNVRPDGDAVRVTWSAPIHLENDHNLQFVDRFDLHRDRWQWRNRPVLAELEGDPDEQRRLTASGLPADAFHRSKRDRSESVRAWERLAAMDRGFVDRGLHFGQWPRRAPQSERDAGGPASDVTLLVDRRDGSSAGDYLRFGLCVWSRYKPLLKNPSRTAHGAGPEDQYRRIAMPYSGTEIKPPKILHILPLPRAIEPDPLKRSGPTPFLVLVDETWFREFGVGERLDARLVLESLDFDKKDGDRPYRAGGLPDHWLPDRGGRPYRGLEIKATKNEANPIVLDAFGPFGLTLDRSPEEALANASAFVVYPPEDVGSHWALYVEFRRVLDKPNPSIQYSRPSASYPIYTLSDAEDLVTTDDPKEDKVVLLPSAEDYLAVLSDGMSWGLEPLSGNRDDLPTLDASQTKAKANYRYFLVVTKEVVAAGQAQLIERPAAILRIETAGEPDDRTYVAHKLRGGVLPTGAYRGRLLEVVVNGQYPRPNSSRLDPYEVANGAKQELTEREFWDGLLTPTTDDDGQLGQDAAGAIRRVSYAFRVLAS